MVALDKISSKGYSWHGANLLKAYRGITNHHSDELTPVVHLRFGALLLYQPQRIRILLEAPGADKMLPRHQNVCHVECRLDLYVQETC